MNRVDNMSRVSLETDNVFRDGYDLQIPTVTGDLSSGYRFHLQLRCLESAARVRHGRQCPLTRRYVPPMRSCTSEAGPAKRIR